MFQESNFGKDGQFEMKWPDLYMQNKLRMAMYVIFWDFESIKHNHQRFHPSIIKGNW